jgi:hypothetical protein
VVLETNSDQMDKSVENEVSRRVKEERNILHTVNGRKTNWICYILPAKCLLQNSIEGNIEETRSLGRRRKQLPDNVKEERR